MAMECVPVSRSPILVAMECVPVSSSSDLKQDVRSCVRSVKIQKLYETFVVSHQ